MKQPSAQPFERLQATYFGTTALTYSIRSGNEQAVRLLLSRPEIDVNFQVSGGNELGLLYYVL
jgi:hypothetical protein